MTDISLISSLQHSLVKHLVKLRTDHTYRYENQLLVLEGIKPLKEVKTWVKKIFYTQDYYSVCEEFNCEKWEISDAILKKVSGMKNPEGLIAEVKMPVLASLTDQDTRVVVFDKINDPGNMGTLLRTALAFNWTTVFFMPDCCDPFNEKVLRAARGAHFKIKLCKGKGADIKSWIEHNQVQALAADIQGDSPEKFKHCTYSLIALGNEAQGVSEELKNLCKRVSLPMKGEMESLNVAVAGGILLYLLSDCSSHGNAL